MKEGDRGIRVAHETNYRGKSVGLYKLYTTDKAGELGCTYRVEEGSIPLACFID